MPRLVNPVVLRFHQTQTGDLEYSLKVYLDVDKRSYNRTKNDLLKKEIRKLSSLEGENILGYGCGNGHLSIYIETLRNHLLNKTIHSCKRVVDE